MEEVATMACFLRLWMFMRRLAIRKRGKKENIFYASHFVRDMQNVFWWLSFLCAANNCVFVRLFFPLWNLSKTGFLLFLYKQNLWIKNVILKNAKLTLRRSEKVTLCDVLFFSFKIIWVIEPRFAMIFNHFFCCSLAAFSVD